MKTIWIILLIILIPVISSAGELAPVGDVPSPKFNPTTPEKVELGKKLFFDRRLSGDGTMSCATCHIPDMGFADGQDISLSYPTTRNWRNSPTLINIAFMKLLFHDGRAYTLEEQALFPIMSAFEMNQNHDFLEEEIRVVPEYRKAFMDVFGGDVDRHKIAMAIAAFERTLVSKNSPLDRFLSGEKSALSREAQKGLEIFKGKGKCTDCHYGVNLSDNAFHALHVPENPKLINDPGTIATMRFVAKVSGYGDYKSLNEDPGRYLVTKQEADWKAFRTPTLRDISRTAPYMHNGIFKTLDQVLEFINNGGGQDNAALKPVGLSPKEKESLKAFLTEALTGEEIVVRTPKLP